MMSIVIIIIGNNIINIIIVLCYQDEYEYDEGDDDY